MAIDWEGVKRDFEGGDSFSKLAEKYGCHESTVRRKAGKEYWKRPGKDAGGKRRKPQSLEGGFSDSILNDHKRLWSGVKKRLIRGIENSDAKIGLEELKVAKIAGEVLSNVIRNERLSMTDAKDAAFMDDADEIAREMARATAPPEPDEALDGE